MAIFGRQAQMTRVAVITATLSQFFLVGCERHDEPAARQTFTEHKLLIAAAPTKNLGESADVYGSSECLSGLAIHAKPEPHTGRYCTAACRATADCPVAWTCVSVYPGPGNTFCAPPENWTSQPTEPRTPSTPPLVSPATALNGTDGGAP